MWNYTIYLERAMDALMPYLDTQTMTKALMIIIKNVTVLPNRLICTDEAILIL